MQSAGPLALSLLLASLPGSCAAPAGSAQEEPGKDLAVTLLGEAAALKDRLREESVLWRRGAPEGWNVSLGTASGAVPPAPYEADAVVFVTLLPPADGVEALLAGLPVELAEDRLRLAGTEYDARAVSLAVRLPGEGGGERWLVASADPEALLGGADRTLVRAVGWNLADDPTRELHYEVRATPWTRRTGAWRQAGDERWVVDPAAERDDFAERRRWRESLRPLDAGAVRLLVPPDREGSPALRELARDLGRAAAAMAPRVPLGAERLRERPLLVAVEADHVAQARHAGVLGPAVPGRSGGLAGQEPPPDLHLVHHPGDGWAYRHAVARALLERAVPEAARSPRLLDGAALWLTGALPAEQAGAWYGRPYTEWLPDLAAADALPEAGGLTAPPEPGGDGVYGGDASEVLWTPAAAGVVQHLEGRTAVDRLAGAGEEAVVAALARMAEEARAEDPAMDGSPGRPQPALPRGFLRGVSLAMWNFSLEAGYHAPAVEERLERLAGLGANAVSLMPFAVQPRPDAPELRFLNDGPTSETDAGMIHAARAAHRKGFAVLWKPHVWVGHGSWPGEVAMTSEEDWRAWWRSYRRYILHHAVLARYAGAELFAVGVELEKTVARRGDWERLVRDVRRVYPGVVTYAANWGAGADRVSFWSALDAAGVDAYYPLAETAGATDEELRRGAEEAVRRLEAVARRAGRPLILTEVGFAARQGAWQAPHEEGGDVSLEHQARAYRALLGALEDRPWLRGVFVWKAFSGERPSWGGGERPDFRFLGRPAEAVVADFFGGLERETGAAPGRP